MSKVLTGTPSMFETANPADTKCSVTVLPSTTTSRQMTYADIPYIAAHYLREHGLEAKGWKFAWDNGRRRAGCCKYGKKLITLSRHYVELNVAERLDDVVDTILHEVAHALTPGHNHDEVWRAKCREIGARPDRCYDSDRIAMPEGKWSATCGGCGKVFRRHKQCKAGAWRYCVECGPVHGRLAFSHEDLVYDDKWVVKLPSQDAPPQPRKLR